MIYLAWFEHKILVCGGGGGGEGGGGGLGVCLKFQFSIRELVPPKTQSSMDVKLGERHAAIRGLTRRLAHG